MTHLHLHVHRNRPYKIVRLLGVCTKEKPFYMLMELMAKGDLKTVLRQNRPVATLPLSAPPPPTPPTRSLKVHSRRHPASFMLTCAHP